MITKRKHKTYALTGMSEDEAVLTSSLVIYGLNQATNKGEKSQLHLGKEIHRLLIESPDLEDRVRERMKKLSKRIIQFLSKD